MKRSIATMGQVTDASGQSCRSRVLKLDQIGLALILPVSILLQRFRHLYLNSILLTVSKMSYLSVPHRPPLPSAVRRIFHAEFSSSRRFPGILNQRSPLPSRVLCNQFKPCRHFISSPGLFSSTPGTAVSSSSGSSEARKTPTPDKKTKNSTPENGKAQPKRKKREDWQIQKDALNQKFKEGWSPPKKLSPDAMDGIRQLHAVAPNKFTTPVLAEQFKVSPEAIRRILKSKWQPTEEEAEDRRIRWRKRHDRIWSQMSELGIRPSRRRTKKYSDSKTLYGDERERPF